MVRKGQNQDKSPSEKFAHFTNRLVELNLFKERLESPSGSHLPILMFYGVGGIGKSWLLLQMRNALRESIKGVNEHQNSGFMQRLWIMLGGSVKGVQSEKDIPHAFLDFYNWDSQCAYASDPAAALEAIARQLDVACPRFQLAFEVLGLKSGTTHGGNWTNLADLAEAGLADLVGLVIPGSNLLVTGIRISLEKARNHRDIYKRWLKSDDGQKTQKKLHEFSDQKIRAGLVNWLALDLAENLPQRPGKGCRAIIFMDTFEHLRLGKMAEFKRQFEGHEKWILDLWGALHEENKGGQRPFVQLVLAGRDRLNWDQFDADCGKPEVLEQHLIGGLSKLDAIHFLVKRSVTNRKLRAAFLRVSQENRNSDAEAYHPFCLGLCADTFSGYRQRGGTIDPTSFHMEGSDITALVNRFLSSVGPEAEQFCLRRLAHTPRFDLVSALACFEVGDGEARQMAFRNWLCTFSFVQESIEKGWYVLHQTMRKSLMETTPEGQHEAIHDFWNTHWLSRSKGEYDDFASLAWYHKYIQDRDGALENWKFLAEIAREELRMKDHFQLLQWWEPVSLPLDILPDEFEGRAMITLGRELCESTCGNISKNLINAIEYYRVALKIITKKSFPQDWAETQIFLGIAYKKLPTGSRLSNLEKAIECYQAALEIYNETKFPEKWALTKNIIGNAYADLPTKDKDKSLMMAINCYQAALKYRSKDNHPYKWAVVQYNMGRAYLELPTKDRGTTLKNAIDCFNETASVFTRTIFPREWAMIQTILGNAYMELPTNSPTNNLEKSVKYYQEALQIFSVEEFPLVWANLQYNLGIAHMNMLEKNRDENLKSARESFLAALTVYNEEPNRMAFPDVWNSIKFNLLVTDKISKDTRRTPDSVDRAQRT